MSRSSLLSTLVACHLAACVAPAPPDETGTGEAGTGEAGTGTAATDAAAAVDPGTGEASRTARALDELSAAYDQLAALVDRNPGEAVDWAQGDIENLGDFEYRIIEFDRLPADDLETELNALGNERWEVFWMESTAAGVRVYVKRPSISYLSRLPLSTLVRLLSGNAQ